jgi:Na+-transporting NADH:ubiquinone oxidoreductase subunit C
MELGPKDDILKIFDERISSIVIDANGEQVETDQEGKPIDGARLDIARQYKFDPSQRLYPVYEFHDTGNPDDIKGYIFAFYGNGLWDNIWGYVALETDMNTVMGAVFDHAAETPGLGARITEKGIQERYEGKKIFNDQNQLVSVSMLKGENNPPSALNDHKINGMSGATITGKGVNRMLLNYFEYYMPFIEKVKQERNKLAKLSN